MQSKFILFITAFSLSACASLPDKQVQTPTEVPTQFTGANTLPSQAVSDWLMVFDDPELLGLVDQAMRANPNVNAARSSLEASLANAKRAGATRLPTLDGTLSATENDPGSSRYSAGFSASWQADIWGRLRDNAKASWYSAEAARADWYGTRLSIAAATAKAWYGLSAAALRTELYRQDVATRQGQLDIVERRFARGVARSSDVRSARSALASSQSSLAAALRSERAAARSLEVLLAKYPNAKTQPRRELPSVGPAPYPGSPENLLERRPDIVAARSRLIAAGFSAEAAQKALYPSLSFRGSVTDAATDISNLDFDNLVSSITGSLTAPIFKAGSLRADRDRAKADAARLAANYASTVLNAFRETENALDADLRLSEQVAALTIAAEEAQAALELVERQYSSGVATIFNLIEAQSQVIRTRTSLITARENRVDNRISLHLAIAGNYAAGGGPKPRLDN